jgi:hypothetical protein
MERVAEYLNNASECLVMADKANEPLRSRLLELSRVWTRLAADRENFLKQTAADKKDAPH